MDLVLTIVGIIALALIVDFAIKMAFLFAFSEKPYVWISLMSAIAIVSWGTIAATGAGVTVPFWSSIIALFINTSPGEIEKKKLYNLGIALFGILCIISYVAFYGESCSPNGECQRLTTLIF